MAKCQGGLYMQKTICELFAGVGGFRLGMERLGTGWNTTWFSQWEPGKINQWAHDCYVEHFGDSPDTRGEYHTGEDISTMDKECIPDHSLLVGGFPCQDYSVAHTLASSHGIEGKKGVLWWQIRDTLIAKQPAFCIFENVDRLLKSPAKQRGRDFGIILACLSQLGYSAEWRVVNAATYGAAQRRRRTFIFAYRDVTVYGNIMSRVEPYAVISQNGFMVQAFPITDCDELKEADLMQYKVEKNAKNIDKITDRDIENISDTFLFAFDKAGYMHKGKIYTCNICEKETEPVLIKQILQSNVDEEYYITEDKKTKWVYLKGAKKIPRKTKEGHEYVFSEGPVAFPDPWDRPGRTMLTSESTLNRSTHVVTDPGTGRLRILTPVEAERLQGFGDDWTDSGMPKRMRYFCMGNALVVPMITRMGKVLDNIIQNEP
jgi:DNA (cytosine-5)-methyltransferase 1